MPRPDRGADLAEPGWGPVPAEAAVKERLLWERDGRDWPNRECSRFVEAGGLRWHVQVAGNGPVLLLLHGTGASTHSWRDLLPLLARDFTVVAPDLPGHAFTARPRERGYSLPAMSAAVATLLEVLGQRPEFLVGHSAGAAVCLRMCLDGHLRPAGVISINGALLPLRGLPGHLFSPAARLLSRLDFVPRVVARRAADRGAVERLLRGTGSEIDARGADLYRRLLACPAHVGATIAMMSRWDLGPLAADLGRLAVPLLLLVGEKDATVAPAEATRVSRRVRRGRVRRLPGLGHLAHEEAPAEVGRLIGEFAGRTMAARDGSEGGDR